MPAIASPKPAPGPISSTRSLVLQIAPADARLVSAIRPPISSTEGAAPSACQMPSIHSPAPSARINRLMSARLRVRVSAMLSSSACCATICVSCSRASVAASTSARRSATAIWSEKYWPKSSAPIRIGIGTVLRLSWWQAISPHSAPLTTIEIDSDAATPIFCRYSQWIGDTERSCANDMSIGSALELSGGNKGTGA